MTLHRRFVALLLALLSVSVHAQTARLAYLDQAESGLRALQRWYNPSTGLYRTTGWWNAANSITVLAGDARLRSPHRHDRVFRNTFARAQRTSPHFLNKFYDDEGWWALAWIDVYDLTQQPQYLDAARTIFADMAGGWDATCGGGIWWSKDRTYKNAIANELFLSVAASLAAHAADAAERRTDLDWAQREWTWFQSTGMINAQNTINDGLVTATCKNNGKTVWSYNQGVILGGLSTLGRLTGDTSLVSTGTRIADAATATLTDKDGVLHDACEPKCGGDGPQFKGIFLRNLAALQASAQNPQYTTFAQKQADSIWTRDRTARDQFGVVWSGPVAGKPDAASQTSALDAILAAAATTAAPR